MDEILTRSAFPALSPHSLVDRFGKPPHKAIRTVGDVTRYHAERRPKRVAARFKERQTTYAELDRRVNRIAQALLATGLRKDDRIVYVGRNSDRYFELLFGCGKAGIILVPISWRLAPSEVEYIVRDCGARLVFADDAAAEAVASIAHRLTTVQMLVAMERSAHGWPAFTEWYSPFSSDDPLVPVTSREAVLQLYTSGTTGRPKGAQLSHANLINAYFGPQATGEAWALWNDEDVSLVVLPVAHISGTGGGFLGYCAGATSVVVAEFEPALVLDAIANQGVSKLVLVPAAIRMLLQTPGVRDCDFGRLSHIFYGASPIAIDLLREALDVFGCDFCQLYGMTETTGPITYLPPEDHALEGNQRMRSAGKPYPHVGLRIRKADGTLAAAGETGELETRSDHNMLGYWNLPEATRDTMSADGWLKTGDAGYLDEDGYLYIQDRIKEMIISGGENIYPAEVESAVFGHPDVADVAVIGVPDPKWGEAVKAIVVAKAGSKPDAAEIAEFAKRRIASFKAPKSVDFIDALPRNASGKILRRRLRELYWKDGSCQAI